MKYALTLLTLIVLLSCGTKKNQLENDTEQTKVVTLIKTELKILVKIPYCGGQRPTEEMLNRTKPVTASFDLLDQNGNTQIVNSDSLGLINLVLPIGKYQLKELSRRMPFELFYNTEITGEKSDIKRGTKLCYEEWYNKSVMSFEITDSTLTVKESAKLFSNCYTKNPCDTYTGPIRP